MRLKKSLLPSIDFRNKQPLICQGFILKNFFIVYASKNVLVFIDTNLDLIETNIIDSDGLNITRINCTENTGRLGVCMENILKIYDPIYDGIRNHNDFICSWDCIFEKKFDKNIHQFSWNKVGDKIIISIEEMIEMYEINIKSKTLDLVWKYKNSSICDIIEFSPDDIYFATSNFNEKFVKVWYNLEKVWSLCGLIGKLNNLINNENKSDNYIYLFTYLLHPQPIKSLCWRNKPHVYNNKYIGNFLLTSCKDGIGRIWADNLKPNDKYKELNNDIKYLVNNLNNDDMDEISPFISFCIITNVNSMSSYNSSNNNVKFSNFFWFNNKEIEIECYTDSIFPYLNEELKSEISDENRDEYENTMELYNVALSKWYKNADIIYAISKLGGSLYTWSVSNLDNDDDIINRAVLCSFSSALTNTIPQVLSSNVIKCVVNHKGTLLSNLDIRQRDFIVDSSLTITSLSSLKDIENSVKNLKFDRHPDILLYQCSYAYTIHKNGSICHWNIEYSNNRSFCNIEQFNLQHSIDGILGDVLSMTVHPYLPIVAVVTTNISSIKSIFITNILIYKFIPILVSLNDTSSWILQSIIKLQYKLDYPYVLWITSIDECIHNHVYFAISFNKEFNIYLMHNSLVEKHNCSKPINCINSDSKHYYYYGVTKMNSINLCDNINNINFMHIYRFLIPYENEQDTFPIFILSYILNDGVKYTLKLIEIYFGSKRVFNRFHVSKITQNSSSLLSSDPVTTSFSKSFVSLIYIGKFDIELNESLPKFIQPLSISSFCNIFEVVNSQIIICHTYNDELIFMEIKLKRINDDLLLSNEILNQNNKYIVFKSFNGRQYGVKFQCDTKSYNGLKNQLKIYAEKEKQVRISFSNTFEAAYITVPLCNFVDNCPNVTIKNVFILRIFGNRLAGIDSWKEECCLHIPFTDFDIHKLSLKELKECSEKMTVSWCSLENGYSLLSIVIYGKILVFSPCPQKNVNAIKYIDNESSLNEIHGSAYWCLLSNLNCEYSIEYNYHSCWVMCGIFILGFNNIIHIYNPDENKNILEQDNPFNIDDIDKYDIGIALKSTSSNPLLSSTTIYSLLILDKFEMIENILLKLYNELNNIKVNNNRSRRMTMDSISISSEFETIKYNDKKSKFEFISPKLYEIISEFFNKTNKYNNVNSIDDQILNEEKCIKFIEMIASVNINNFPQNECNFISIICEVISNINELYKKNCTVLDELGKQFIYFTRLQYYISRNEEYKYYDDIIFSSCSFYYLCAFHSNCQNELIKEMKFGLSENLLTWKYVSKCGFGWWIKDDINRKNILESIAKCEYLVNKDPLDAALYYLLIDKKSIIITLYKLKKDFKMISFFSQDFTLKESCIIAQKNAYHLLSVHRYFHSITFFILASLYWDAIQVCISNIYDIQLGFLLATVYNNVNNESLLKRFIYTYIFDSNNNIIYHDPFIRSLSYWILEKPIESIITLVEKSSSNTKYKGNKEYILKSYFNNNVCDRIKILYMYNYLKKHIKIIKHFSYQAKGLVDKVQYKNIIINEEYLNNSFNRLSISCIKYAQNQGYIHLSLLILIELNKISNNGKVGNKLCKLTVKINKNLVFNSIIRCIIEDIKNSNEINLLEVLWKDLKIVEIFCNTISITNIKENIDENIINYKFNEINDYMFIQKYSYILYIIFRHFLLYGLNYLQIILYIINILYDNICNESSISSNNILPPLLITNNEEEYCIDVNNLYSKIANNIINKNIVKLNKSIYNIDKNNMQYEIIYKKIQIYVNISNILSNSLYYSLGGYNIGYSFKKLLTYGDNIVFEDESQNIQLFYNNINEFCKLIDFEFNHQVLISHFNISISKLIVLLEVYFTIITVYFLHSFLLKDAQLCYNILHQLNNFSSNIKYYFGGVGSSSNLKCIRSTLSSVSTARPHSSSSVVIPVIPHTSTSTGSTNEVICSDKTLNKASNDEMMYIYLSPTLNIVDFIEIKNDASSSSNYEEDEERTKIEKYAWSIMISGIYYHYISNMKKILNKFNISLTKIYNYSKCMNSLINYINQERIYILAQLDNNISSIIPNNFLPFIYENNNEINDIYEQNSELLKQFCQVNNTPFEYDNSKSTLWNTLTSIPCIAREMLLFSYEPELLSPVSDINHISTIYVDNDLTYDMCINNSDTSIFVLATQNHLLEFHLQYGSINNILEWQESYKSQSNMNILSDYMKDVKFLSHYNNINSSQYYNHSNRYKKSLPLLIKKEMKNSSSNTYLVQSHPTEPYFISAIHETDIYLYQFGVIDHLHQFNSDYHYTRITHLSFNQNGNKFGVMDENGTLTLSLFHTNSSLVPFFKHQCHTKYGSSFTFLNTSSLIATCGYSFDGYDIALWDTLMPTRNILSHTFSSNQHGSTKLLYSSHTNSLLIGCKKGALLLYDLRTHKIIQSITHAHNSTITSLVHDEKGIFVSGSSDGIVKIWKQDNQNNLNNIQTIKPIPTYSTRSKDLPINNLTLRGRYLFISSQNALTLRKLE